MVVLQPTTVMTPKKPVRNSIAIAGQKARAAARPSSPPHASAAAANMSARGGRGPAIPSDSAPDTAPTPSEAMRKPKPSAPRPSTVRTTSGTYTVKLKTQKLTKKQRPRASIISRVRHT